MAYIPSTSAGKEVHMLMGELSTAQHQWNTYATQLGRGYTAAYKEHETAIKAVQEKYRLAAESAYWVLSLLCVAFAGGIAGGLMAPWVEKAGSLRARTILDEMSQTVAQGTTQKGLEATRSGADPFKPAMKSPLEYWQDMHGEIGLCFSDLRASVEAWMSAADSDPRYSNPTPGIKKFVQTPLLRDAPKDMPDEKKIAREAELGMWIAWAHVRDIDYWKERVDAVTNNEGRHYREAYTDKYMKEFQLLQPIVDRLKSLGVPALGTSTAKPGLFAGPSRAETVLDINKLRTAGAYLAVLPEGAHFFGRVGEVVKDPQKVLPQMSDVRPIYKRAA